MSVHYRSRTQDLNLNNRVISFIVAHIKCDRSHRLAVGTINSNFRNWGQYCVCGKHAEWSFSRIPRPCRWKSDKSQWTVGEILRGINQCLEIIVFGIVCLFFAVSISGNVKVVVYMKWIVSVEFIYVFIIVHGLYSFNALLIPSKV